MNNTITPTNIYIVDTSALITLKDTYPQDIFPSMWNNLTSLIREDRLKAPIQVYNEIKRKDDELTKFVANKNIHNKLFVNNTTNEYDSYVINILKLWPNLIDHNKPIDNPNDECADPYVIALAVYYYYNPTLTTVQLTPMVVTEEKIDRKRKLSIPTVCKNYNQKYNTKIDGLIL